MAMGMAGGTKPGASGIEEFLEPPIVSEINITPLTDIFLVLLIIFMVTSSVLSQMGIQVQLPKASQATSSSQGAAIVVTVTSQSEIFVNGERTSEGDLGAKLKELLQKSADKTVILEGDRRAVLGTIVRVMDEGKKAGAGKFAVATKEEQ